MARTLAGAERRLSFRRRALERSRFVPYAHSPNSQGEWHELVAHLRAVAALASQFATAFGAREAAYWLGLWHDVGKFHPEWQRYLRETHAGTWASTARA